MSRRATVVVALLLASALGTATLSDCMAGFAMGPQAQMACCKAGHDKCPMHGAHASAADCCKTDSQRQQQLAAAEYQPVHTSAIAIEQIAALAVHALIRVDVDSTTIARYHTGSSSPSTPRAFLATVLLI